MESIEEPESKNYLTRGERLDRYLPNPNQLSLPPIEHRCYLSLVQFIVYPLPEREIVLSHI